MNDHLPAVHARTLHVHHLLSAQRCAPASGAAHASQCKSHRNTMTGKSNRPSEDRRACCVTFTAPLRTNLHLILAEALYAPARVCPKIAELSAASFMRYPSSTFRLTWDYDFLGRSQPLIGASGVPNSPVYGRKYNWQQLPSACYSNPLTTLFTNPTLCLPFSQ
jgi:hypothetical protein